MTALQVHRVAAELHPDPARVVGRLFLPGEEAHATRSRAAVISERVMALPEAEIEQIAHTMVADFTGRHRNYGEMLARHASIVAGHVAPGTILGPARLLVLGACFTAEFATEAAALCNPSAVLHPDQSGLLSGQARVAVSLRAVGEGHISSISFCTALVGPGPRWVFEERKRPAVAGRATPTAWSLAHLRAVMRDQSSLEELASTVISALPDPLTIVDLEVALAQAFPDLLGRMGGQATGELLRKLVTSAYEVEFDDDVELSQRVLTPSTPEESNGMEDARFTRFVEADGTVDYRATYTAYDGHDIAPRLLRSPDLKVFRSHRMAGPAARNKGIALFPRLVGGRHFALCRIDGESTSVASSADGLSWAQPEVILPPTAPWELLQVGNCGPPIETDRGWLVLTHGVGAMRTYVIGAALLDIDDPTAVLARLPYPLLQPAPDARDGYVPNVVYSCGGVVHEGRLWMPFGIDDARIGVVWVSVAELLDAMVPHVRPHLRSVSISS